MQKEMKQPALSGACEVDEEKPPESWQVAEAEGRALTPQEREAREDYRHRELFADRFFRGFYAWQKKQFAAEQAKAAEQDGASSEKEIATATHSDAPLDGDAGKEGKGWNTGKRRTVCVCELPQTSEC